MSTVVAKIGTSSITDERGAIAEDAIKKLVAEFNDEANKPDAQSQPVQLPSAPHITNIQITNVIVNIGFRKVRLTELTEDDLQELARILAAA